MKHQHQQKKTNICTQKSGEAPLGGKEEEEAKNKREEDGKDWDVRCDFVAIRTTPGTTKKNGNVQKNTEYSTPG